jgi:hypothetical protein
MLRVVGVASRFLPLVLGCWLGTRFPVLQALGIAAAAAAGSVALGALLLHGSPLGQVTWRNVLAMWLLPWGFLTGAGRLAGIAATAFGAWLGLAAIGVLGWSQPWLLAAWLLDAVALRFLLASAWRTGDRVQRRVVVRLAGLVLALAAAGLAAALLGHPLVGAAIAGGPLALVGVPYGLFVLAAVVLRPRWN